MRDAFDINPLITGKKLRSILDERGYTQGCTEQHVKNWLRVQRTKTDRHITSDVTLGKLKELIRDLEAKTQWIGEDVHRSLLLPIPDSKHLIEGKEVKEQKPRKTVHHHPFAFCLPISTPRLLQRRIDCRNLRVKVLKGVSLEQGAEMMEIDNLGFSMIDGLTTVMAQNQGSLLPIGTVTRNGHFRLIAICAVSGETAWTTCSALKAVENAAATLFPGQDTSAQWHLADAGPVAAGIRKYLSDRHGGRKGGESFNSGWYLSCARMS